MNNNFKNVMGEIMFPSTFKCVCCGNEIATENMLICDKCYKALPFITGKTCDVCGEPIRSDSKLCLNCKRERPKFTKAFSLLKYEPPVSNLIKNLKYDGATYLTSTLSAFIMKCYLLNKIEADVVIPVPIHYERYKERGFN